MARKTFAASMPAEMFMTGADQEPQPQTKGGPQITTPTDTEPSGATPAGYKKNPEYIETKSRRVQLLMQPSLYTKLKEKAQADGKSVNDLIHQILLESMGE